MSRRVKRYIRRRRKGVRFLTIPNVALFIVLFACVFGLSAMQDRGMDANPHPVPTHTPFCCVAP